MPRGRAPEHGTANAADRAAISLPYWALAVHSNRLISAIPPHARPPPGSYHTSWIGNSFGGGGALPGEGVNFPGNGFGYWVQDNVGAIAVSNDGTVFDETEWDEGGRFLGLYKRTVNLIAFRLSSAGEGSGLRISARRAPRSALMAAFSTLRMLTPTRSSPQQHGQFAHLLRFSWVPGDINSAKIY